MTTETLYKPKGAGHKTPDGERRNYVKPRDELMEAFGQWLKIYRNGESQEMTDYDMYKHALDMMPDLEGFSDNELNSIPLIFENDANVRHGGYFLTAAYNKSDRSDFVFDCDVELECVGYRLGEDKRLIITSDTGAHTGTHNHGKIVNYGVVDGNFGSSSDGQVFNFGGCFFFAHMTAGTGINYGRIPGSNYHPAPYILFSGEGGKRWSTQRDSVKNIHGLQEYVESLAERLGPENPPEEVFKALDGLDTGTDIRKIYKDNWYMPDWRSTVSRIVPVRPIKRLIRRLRG